LEQGKDKNKKSWRRPKEVFFNSCTNPNIAGQPVVNKVSVTCCVGCMLVCLNWV
jgi:hypothetical protein